jgi:hypothetical protein
MALQIDFRQDLNHTKGGPKMNRFCSIFSQLLQLFPKAEFIHAVKRTGAERRTKGFSGWGQFVAMVCGTLLTRLTYEISYGLW